MQGLRIAQGSPIAVEAGAYVGGFQCDSAGNVFYVPMAPTMGPNHNPRPDTFVRVSADGPETRVHVPASLGLANPDDFLEIRALAIDPQGAPHVLADVREDGSVHSYVISFKKDGQLERKLKVHVDRAEASVRGLAAFGSRTFLLVGTRGIQAIPFLAVMGQDGSLQDVALPAAARDEASRQRNPFGPSLVVPGTNGLVYAWQDRDRLYGIEPSGRVAATIQLERPEEAGDLVQLKASNNRLAALYGAKPPAGGGASRWWIATYDIDAGKPVALYGPLDRLVMCYGMSGSADRFTLLRGEGGRHYADVASPR